MMSFGPTEVIAEELAIDGVERVVIFGSSAACHIDQPAAGPPTSTI